MNAVDDQAVEVTPEAAPWTARRVVMLAGLVVLALAAVYLALVGLAILVLSSNPID